MREKQKELDLDKLIQTINQIGFNNLIRTAAIRYFISAVLDFTIITPFTIKLFTIAN